MSTASPTTQLVQYSYNKSSVSTLPLISRLLIICRHLAQSWYHLEILALAVTNDNYAPTYDNAFNEIVIVRY